MGLEIPRAPLTAQDIAQGADKSQFQSRTYIPLRWEGYSRCDREVYRLAFQGPRAHVRVVTEVRMSSICPGPAGIDMPCALEFGHGGDHVPVPCPGCGEPLTASSVTVVDTLNMSDVRFCSEDCHARAEEREGMDRLAEMQR